MTKAEKHRRWDDMRAYKAQGYTMQEVADQFELSVGTAQRICKGIAPQTNCQKGRPSPNKGILQDENKVAAFIESKMPDVEYVGNYTGADGRADIKCKTCGTVFNRSMISIRKAHCSCPACRGKELGLAKERRRIAEDMARAERERKRTDRRRKEQEREAEREARREAWRNRPFRECLVCGTLTQNPKYCCADCRRKANNSTHEHRRRALIESQMIDKDITLEGLFRRDNGVCAICGKRCNYEDYTVRDGAFIAGDWYPSIDHIRPITKGGLHSWGNVQLAHRHCNTIKSDSE